MWIIVGLGNPGQEYRFSRHNIGFMVVDVFAGRNRFSWRGRGGVAEVGQSRLAGQEFLTIKPMVFMNRSGEAVAPILRRMGVRQEGMVVVHDDLDLPFGRIKIKEGGGSGGHRGVQSVIDALGSEDFLRLKMGIGRPEFEELPEAYVLSRFPAEEAERLPMFLEIGAEALECVLREGSGRAMNRYNIDRQWDRKEEKQRKKAQKVGVEGEEPETEEKEGSDG